MNYEKLASPLRILAGSSFFILAIYVYRYSAAKAGERLRRFRVYDK